MKTLTWTFHALCAAVLAAAASPVWACAVCFGKSDSPIVKGVELSVIFMVILVYTVIGGGLAGFVALRVRARRATAGDETSRAVPELSGNV